MDEFEAKVKEFVQAAPFCGITADLWTEDHTKKDYLGVTLHLWLPGARKLLRLVLHLNYFNYEEKRGIHIREELEAVGRCFLLEWKRTIAVSGEFELWGFVQIDN